MKVLAVVNPAAGGGRGRERFERVRPLLPWPAADIDVTYTDAPGHAAQLAEDAAERSYALVLAVGGDGTASEVAGALAHRDTALAVLPTGTGCDLARSLNMPIRADRAARAMAAWQVRSIDLGQIGDRYFVNVAGLGFDAEVAQEVNRIKDKTAAGGTWPYLLGVGHVLRAFHGPVATTFADGSRQTGPILLIAFANGRCYGGGMRIAPSADPADGRLDMVRVDAMRPAQVVTLLPSVFLGLHGRSSAVHLSQVSHVELSVDTPATVHCDGDLWRTVLPGEALSVQVCPAALRCLRPAKRPVVA